MDKELFDQLHQSMKEAVAIAEGEMEPSRVFRKELPDVKAVREKTGLSQAGDVRCNGRREGEDPAELGATPAHADRCRGGAVNHL